MDQVEMFIFDISNSSMYGWRICCRTKMTNVIHFHFTFYPHFISLNQKHVIVAPWRRRQYWRQSETFYGTELDIQYVKMPTAVQQILWRCSPSSRFILMIFFFQPLMHDESARESGREQNTKQIRNHFVKMPKSRDLELLKESVQ